MVIHSNLNLFDAPKGSIIVHACNSQGVWGSGIAKSFRERYPISFDRYRKFCHEANEARGTACSTAGLSISLDEPHKVGWLITSHDFSVKKDPPELIKIHTVLAVTEFCKKVCSMGEGNIDVYSNKFNSGLFSVPWENSELILKTVLKDYPRISWIVCDPEA